MPLVKPQAPPGFFSQATQVQARGGWWDGNLVRWRLGLLEKIAGWRRLIEEQLPSVMRRFHAWLDLKNRKNLLIATDSGVHILVQEMLYGLGHAINLEGGYVPELGVLGAPTLFSVGLNSTEVTVKTPVVASVGGTFLFRISISIGGRIILAGTFFKVKSVIDGVEFTFDMPLPALVAETDTYGVALLTNDLVNAFTVTWKAHGLIPGSMIKLGLQTTLKLGTKNATTGEYDEVNFDAPTGSAVNVDTVVDADHFTVKMGTLGTGDGAGGISHQVFVGNVVEHPTGSAITGSVGSVIGLAAQTPLGNPQRQTWFLANIGEDGLVLASGGALERYHPPIEDGPFLTPVTNPTTADPPVETAPQKSAGMIVAMPQAQVILFGTEAIPGSGVVDPLLIVWSHVGTYDQYRATVSNQAGSFRLSRGSRIVGMIQAPQNTLILTDTDLWQMSYIGPPLVYGFTIMGSGCGLVAPHAVGVLGRSTIWQGQKNFWQFGDTAVQPVPCTVWDYIFTDIDGLNINKCHAAPNSGANELAFYFPSLHTMINVDKNLLLFSQLFNESSRWTLTNALAHKFSRYKTVYDYEPQYMNLGWFSDEGVPPISWFDDELQAVPDGVFAPDGTDTTFLLQETATNGTHSVSQRVDKLGERTTYTLSIYVHKTSTRNLTLRAVTDLGEVYATFYTLAGGLLAEGVTSPRFQLLSAYVMHDELATGTAGVDGNGWHRLVLTFTSDDSEFLDIFFNITNGTEQNYLGVPPNGVLIWGAQLVLGAEPLEYQKSLGVQRQNETRRYVKVNAAEGLAWDSGRLSRSAWLDESVWGPALGADTTVIPPAQPAIGQPPLTTAALEQAQNMAPMRNLIQQHERGFDDDQEPMKGVFAETGFTELGDGTMVMLIDQVHPDMKWFGRDGGVKVSFRTSMYPQGPKHLYGPYSMTPDTEWFNPRVRARYAAVRYDWEPRLGYSARVGLTTFHVKPAGRLP